MKNKGFTIIEGLVSICLISLISFIVIKSANNFKIGTEYLEEEFEDLKIVEMFNLTVGFYEHKPNIILEKRGENTIYCVNNFGDTLLATLNSNLLINNIAYPALIVSIEESKGSYLINYMYEEHQYQICLQTVV